MHKARTEVVQAHAGPLVQALLKTTVPLMVAAVYETMPAPVQQDYVTAVARELAGDPKPSLVAGAVTVAERCRSEAVAGELKAAIGRWLNGHGGTDVRKRVGEALDGWGTRNPRALWHELSGRH